MITNLHIDNYALIEHLDIDLHSGFSVITGETGAGKSIILGAIGLLLGQRADIKSIKTGASRCVIEATFNLSNYGFGAFFDENDIDFDGSECIVRRELTAAGKSRAFINDTPVSLALLKELGEQLIDVHSQHKNLLIGKEDFQLNVLDILAGNADLLSTYKKEYKLYRELCAQYDEIVEKSSKSHDEEDYLRFQVNQLSEASLVEGEQTELEKEQEVLEHAEEIKQALYTSSQILQASNDGPDTLQLLKQSRQTLESVSRVWADAEQLVQRLESCYLELKDIADEIDSQCENIEYDPMRLEFVNERLNVIYTLERKHGLDSVEALLALQRELEHKLLLIDNSDEFIEEVRKKRDAQYEVALSVAKQLSEKRQAMAVTLEASMVERLQPLGMPNVRFKSDIHTSELTTTGIDVVEFLFAANKGGLLQPISKVASGGEIARVMLSLKSLIAGAVKLPTIIFDEIDTGVSGSIAEKMARTMQEMGNRDRQVISITHLPQIAALGSSHYKVYKEDRENATLSHIVELTHEQRVEEIAHMLSGENLTEAAIQNAASLLGG